MQAHHQTSSAQQNHQQCLKQSLANRRQSNLLSFMEFRHDLSIAVIAINRKIWIFHLIFHCQVALVPQQLRSTTSRVLQSLIHSMSTLSDVCSTQMSRCQCQFHMLHEQKAQAIGCCSPTPLEEKGSVSAERARHHTLDLPSVGTYCIVAISSLSHTVTTSSGCCWLTSYHPF